MARNKRKRKFIDSKVQGALIRRIAWHYVIFFATACTFAFFLQVLADPLSPLNVHLRKLWLTQGPFIIVAACLLPVFMRDTIMLSHRFVGPILRIRNTIRQASREDNAPLVKLRPGDFWVDLADDLNGLLTRMNAGTSKASEQTEEIAC
jgi:hypothetical protein